MSIEMPRYSGELRVRAELARTLIETGFPELAPVSLSSLGQGWDNSVWLVNGELVFRFPRREVAAECIEAEIRVLPALAGRLPLRVPLPTHVGQPAAEFPWPFMGHRLIPGRDAGGVVPGRGARIAAAGLLGDFLRELHALPADEMQRAGARPDAIGRLDHAGRAGRAHVELNRIVSLGLVPDATPHHAAIDAAADVEPAGPLVLVHGDLHAGQLLLDDEERPCGCIDWGDVHLGHRAVDLSLAHTYLPAEGRATFGEAYGPIDDATRTLACFRAVYHTATVVLYAYAIDDDAMLREALTSLQHTADG